MVVVQSLSCVQLFETLWTTVRQTSLSFTVSWSLLKVMHRENSLPSKISKCCYLGCGQDHCPLPQEHLHLSIVPLPTRWTLGCSSKRGGIFWIVLYKIYMSLYFCMCAKSLQLCPTLCDPMDCSPPGSSIHRILQARILEWVAVSSSRGSS